MSRATSHNRIAWAWLDKLLNQPTGRNKAEAPPAQEMTARERDRILEGAYEDIKRVVIDTIASQIPVLDSIENAIAQRHGLDPVFLNWFILNSKHWPSLSQRVRNGLEAMKSVRMWFGAVPDHWRNMRVPDISEARERDAALRELGEWFVRNFVDAVERKYIAAIWKKSRELAGVFAGPGSRPDSKASVHLMREFEKRLTGDRFQLKPAVQKVVDLFE